MSRGERLCYSFALILLAIAAWSALPSFGFGRVDDWRYAGPVSLPMQMLVLSVVAALLPAVLRLFRRRFMWILSALGVVGLVFAIAVPSLLRARMSAGGLSVGGA